MLQGIARLPVRIEELTGVPIHGVVFVTVIDLAKCRRCFPLSVIFAPPFRFVAQSLKSARLTFCDHAITIARHEAALLWVQPGHSAHLGGAPVEPLPEGLVAFAAVVEVCQDGLCARVRGAHEWHVQISHLGALSVFCREILHAVLGFTYRSLPSLCKVSLELHLQLVVLQQDKRRQERHVPVLWLVLLDHDFQLPQYLLTERQQNAVDDDGRKLVVHIRRRRSPVVEGVTREVSRYVLVILGGPAAPSRLDKAADNPESECFSEKQVLL